jgi:hypothetical protein
MSDRNILKHFREDTAEHQLTVIKEDGLYRHLRCRKPWSIVYGFDIITWPGYLAYVGDMGDFLFTRAPDMLGFFGSEGISPDYWSEKVVAEDRDRVREFSVERYRERVEEWRDEIAGDMADDCDCSEAEVAAFQSAVDDDLLDRADDLTEEKAHELLSEFSHEGITCSDSWEWSLRRFTWHYIWACYAITWAVGQYLEHGAAVQS